MLSMTGMLSGNWFSALLPNECVSSVGDQLVSVLRQEVGSQIKSVHDGDAAQARGHSQALVGFGSD